MSKYKVEVIAKQRYTMIVDATDEETAVQGTLDVIEENPEGYLTGTFNKFLMGPDVEVTELEEVSI
jgi:hypothetical protein